MSAFSRRSKAVKRVTGDIGRIHRSAGTGNEDTDEARKQWSNQRRTSVHHSSHGLNAETVAPHVRPELNKSTCLRMSID
jgi:hypothetical protein